MPRPMKTGQPWEAWEIDYLDIHYRCCDIKKIAKRLRRTPYGVKKFAQRMNIKRHKQ